MNRKHLRKPAADEAACPVVPLMREYARCLRAADKLRDDDAQAFVERTTMAQHDLGPTPEHATNVIARRRAALEAMAQQLTATSSLGLAFQLLLIQSRSMRDSVAGEALHATMEAQGIIWKAYEHVASGLNDVDLTTVAEWLGSNYLTDAESAQLILKAVA